jgi:hypothetical protein
MAASSSSEQPRRHYLGCNRKCNKGTQDGEASNDRTGCHDGIYKGVNKLHGDNKNVLWRQRQCSSGTRVTKKIRYYSAQHRLKTTDVAVQRVKVV